MAANLEPSTDVRPSGSKLDLIQATVAAISQHGLSELTSAKIASVAGHTAASINFHFGSKEALLLATLREVSEEFAGAMARVLEEAGDDDLRALLGIVDASLGRALPTRTRSRSGMRSSPRARRAATTSASAASAIPRGAGWS